MTEFSELRAPAKVNLCLRVGARRPDGYHPVVTLMEKVDLFDRLQVAEGAGRVTVTGDDLPPGLGDDSNTVSRAMDALSREVGRNPGLDVTLSKNIPVAAGLAGGSSDAAAILRDVPARLGLDIGKEHLAAMAVGIGADVPFFLVDGPRLVLGIGERLEPATGLPVYHLVLAKPELGLSTARVYQEFDERVRSGEDTTLSSDELDDAAADLRYRLTTGIDIGGLASVMINDLEPAAMALEPAIAVVKSKFLDAGAAGALMSGSGPSVFAIFPTEDEALAAAELLSDDQVRTWVLKPLRG